jgi:hypothetical protein
MIASERVEDDSGKDGTGDGTNNEHAVFEDEGLD